MYFGIYNSHTIKNWIPKGKQPIIIGCLSKSEYNTSKLEIKNQTQKTKILLLDIKDDHNLTLENIQKLNNFIINNEFDEIITFCALGISRSPAIMICISKIIQNQVIEKTIKENYKYYNKYIVSDFENTSYKTKTINDQVFIPENLTYHKETTKEKQKTKSISLKY